MNFDRFRVCVRSPLTLLVRFARRQSTHFRLDRQARVGNVTLFESKIVRHFRVDNRRFGRRKRSVRPNGFASILAQKDTGRMTSLQIVVVIDGRARIRRVARAGLKECGMALDHGQTASHTGTSGVTSTFRFRPQGRLWSDFRMNAVQDERSLRRSRRFKLVRLFLHVGQRQLQIVLIVGQLRIVGHGTYQLFRLVASSTGKFVLFGVGQSCAGFAVAFLVRSIGQARHVGRFGAGRAKVTQRGDRFAFYAAVHHQILGQIANRQEFAAEMASRPVQNDQRTESLQVAIVGGARVTRRIVHRRRLRRSRRHQIGRRQIEQRLLYQTTITSFTSKRGLTRRLIGTFVQIRQFGRTNRRLLTQSAVTIARIASLSQSSRFDVRKDVLHRLAKVRHTKRIHLIELTKLTILVVHFMLGQRNADIFFQMTLNPSVSLRHFGVRFLAKRITALSVACKQSKNKTLIRAICDGKSDPRKRCKGWNTHCLIGSDEEEPVGSCRYKYTFSTSVNEFTLSCIRKTNQEDPIRRHWSKDNASRFTYDYAVDVLFRRVTVVHDRR
jgi:hypothetical protein